MVFIEIIDKTIERDAWRILLIRGAFFGNVRVGLANIRDPAVEIRRCRILFVGGKACVAFIGMEREIELAHKVKQLCVEFIKPRYSNTPFNRPNMMR